jgi:hypothetical protein
MGGSGSGVSYSSIIEDSLDSVNQVTPDNIPWKIIATSAPGLL